MPSAPSGSGGAWLPQRPKLEQEGLQGAAPFGQLVEADAGRRTQVPPLDDAVLGQLPEPLAEHVRAHAAQAAEQVVEALGAEQEVADHQHRPPLAEDIESTRHTTRIPIATHAAHGPQATADPNLGVMLVLQELFL